MENYKSVVNGVMHIDLTEKHRDERELMLGKFSEWVREKNLALEGKDEATGVVAGQKVEVWAGYYNHIRYKAEVLGFIDGKCYLLWDCWWFGIDLVERGYVIKD